MRLRSTLPVVLAATGLAVLVGGHEALAIAEWRGSDGFWRGRPYASAPASLIDHDRSLWLQNLLLVSVAVLGAVATPIMLWHRRGRQAGLAAAAAACGVALLPGTAAIRAWFPVEGAPEACVELRLSPAAA